MEDISQPTPAEVIPKDPKGLLDYLASSPVVSEVVAGISTLRSREVTPYVPGDVDGMIAAMQATFNFRENGEQRSDIPDLPGIEKYKASIDFLTDSIGLTGDTVPVEPDADAVIVLGARVKGIRERTEYTKELLDRGTLKTDTIVFLGSGRAVDDDEKPFANGAKDEYELMKNAAAETFKVVFDEDSELQGYDASVATGFKQNWKVSYAKTADGRNVFVLSAPMLSDTFHKNGKRRERANTSDTFQFFAKVTDMTHGGKVVAVTNAHFRPFQGAEAVADLARLGIKAEAVGFDPAHFENPSKRQEELLQETLKTVHSLKKQHDTLAVTLGSVGVFSTVQ